MSKIRLNSVVWYHYHGALLPKVKPDQNIELSEAEAKKLLRESKAFFLRYTSNWDMKKESEFWYVIKDSREELSSYSSKMRNQIKKGLKNCEVKKVTNLEIAKNGYMSYSKAFKKYKTDLKPMGYDTFYKNTLKSNGYDYFAVYNKQGEMIAYSTNKIEDDSCSYMTIKYDPDYLKLYPSYALIFEMNHYYLNKLDFKYVSDGARSISHDINIQDYLIQKFKFPKAYCKLHIVYRSDVKIIVSILFPFRNIVFKLNNKLFNKISILLKQEEIKRSYE